MTLPIMPPPTSNPTARSEAASKPGTVSLALLLWLTVTFACGVIASFIVQNASANEQIAFSTASLISFLFGIALSAASIVLAVAAISLGKASEQAMIDRSDQSIRLQNEVFLKTTEALARIESSTGTTEKRIEDIISGRAGDLSHAIAERIATKEPATTDRANLEREIKESLLAELSATRTVAQTTEREEMRQRAEEAARAYRQFQSNVLTAVVRSGLADCRKIGDGRFDAQGDDLFDGVFVVQGKAVAVASLSTRALVWRGHFAHFEALLKKAATELAEGRTDRVLFVFDGELPEKGAYRRAYAEFVALAKPDIATRIALVDGVDGAASEKTVEYIAQLAKE